MRARAGTIGLHKKGKSWQNSSNAVNSVFSVFSGGGGGGRTGNRRFWAASRPNPAPEGGLRKAPAGAPVDLHQFQPGRPFRRPVREVFLNPLVTALGMRRVQCTKLLRRVPGWSSGPAAVHFPSGGDSGEVVGGQSASIATTSEHVSLRSVVSTAA